MEALISRGDWRVAKGAAGKTVTFKSPKSGQWVSICEPLYRVYDDGTMTPPFQCPHSGYVGTIKFLGWRQEEPAEIEVVGDKSAEDGSDE